MSAYLLVVRFLDRDAALARDAGATTLLVNQLTTSGQQMLLEYITSTDHVLPV